MKLRRSKDYILFFIILFIISATVAHARLQEDRQNLNIGAGMFSMPENTGVNSNDLKVFYYRPSNWTPDRPIVIVQHGVQRNAEEYRNEWQPYADKYNLLVACPHFSKEKYPGVRFYNLGNITNSDEGGGMLQPRDTWIFPVIDRVFNEVRVRTGATSDKFILFGHSAGAQLVHRYILFSGKTRAARIISANAGWYTMPDASIDFPYGIKDMPMTNEALARAFVKPVTILLGEKDKKLDNKVLRHTPESDYQGLNRFERGETFYSMAKAKAAELGVPFNWALVTVPGVGHDDVGMAAAAAKLIAEGQW
ncbi:MAG: hypothetical protein K0Q87_2836 [Neobacillus sp.]|nr:hypothetical protein [Neobacillus sp.]